MTRGQLSLKKQEKAISRLRLVFQSWYQKWNNICLLMMVIILFILMAGIVVLENLKHSKKHVSTEMYSLERKIKVYQPINCKFIFNDNDILVLSEFIEEESKKSGCFENIYLEMQLIKFPDGIMKSTWYQHRISVVDLTINNCNIRDIEENSFASPAFEYLRSLSLVNLPIKHLKKNMFNGLTKLDQFNLREMNDNLRYDPDFVFNFKRLGTLQILQTISKPEDLMNITGTEYFDNISSLKILDLRYNQLIYLPANVFKSSSLESLYLEGCSLSRIDDNALKLTKNLKLLQISGNKFKTLSNSSFGFLRNFKIEIKENPWVCDCNLLWLKNMSINDRDATKCSGKTEVAFDHADFVCDESTVPISTTTSKATTLTTTSSSATPSESTVITSEDSISSDYSEKNPISSTDSETTTATTTSPNFSSSSTNKDDTSSIRSSTQPSTKPTEAENIIDDQNCEQSPYALHTRKSATNRKTIKIEERDDGIVFVKLLTNYNSPYKLIWFNSDSDNQDQKSCSIPNTSEAIAVRELQPNTAYVMCAEPDDESNLTLNTCAAVKTQPIQEERSWIQNKHKIPIIIIGIFCLIIITLLTGIMSFLFIRKHPRLLKGNKRVVIVKSPSTDVLVMPTNKPYFSVKPKYEVMDVRDVVYERNKYGGYITRREPGYMTPISRQYTYMRSRPNLARSTSGTSTWTLASYVTENQIRSAGRQNRRTRIPVSSVFESPIPPPLPPPRRKSTDLGYEIEDQYW